uniref:Uncharacterized protein n=1 Tax=Rhizophora mucronata TaxID=61149 RepID=A0A2P2NK67_RHIMU
MIVLAVVHPNFKSLSLDYTLWTSLHTCKMEK